MMWYVGYVVSSAAAILLGRFFFRRENVASIVGLVCFEAVCGMFLTFRHQLAPAGQWDRVPWVFGWFACIAAGLLLGAWSNAWGRRRGTPWKRMDQAS